MRKFVTLRLKKTILAEAFSKPNNIKPTARAYSVLLKQIRRWRTMFASLPVPAGDYSDEDNGNQPNRQLSQILNKKTAHQGGVGKSVGKFEMLRSTFDGLRQQQDRCCTIRMLVIELKRVAGNENVPLAARSKRVKRWMVKEGIILWRVTHVAQNTTRLDQSDWVFNICQSTDSDLWYVAKVHCQYWWDKQQFWLVWIIDIGEMWSQDHWNDEDFRYLLSLHCALRCHSKWIKAASIHCVQGNQWWTDKQAVSHQSTKRISGFSEILLPGQGVGKPNCLLELDWAGLEALDSGIPRRANLPANGRLFGPQSRQLCRCH